MDISFQCRVTLVNMPGVPRFLTKSFVKMVKSIWLFLFNTTNSAICENVIEQADF